MSLSGYEVQGSDPNQTLFNPSFIDDYGFTPEEFRVFARIMRRAGREGVFYESIPSLTKSLQISRALIRRALNVLVDCRAVVREIRPGKAPLIRFNPGERWRPADELPKIRKAVEAKIKEYDRKRKADEATPTVSVTGNGNGSTPLTETAPEGSPLKAIPLKGSKEPMSVSTDVLAVFEYWQKVMNHPKSKLTRERRDAIKRRLGEKYTVQDICNAIDGCKASPHHQGKNDTGAVYDDLTLICRTGSKLEWFADLRFAVPHNPDAGWQNVGKQTEPVPKEEMFVDYDVPPCDNCDVHRFVSVDLGPDALPGLESEMQPCPVCQPEGLARFKAFRAENY